MPADGLALLIDEASVKVPYISLCIYGTGLGWGWGKGVELIGETSTTISRYQGSWGQHGVHLGPTGSRWAPCWPHELCYLGNHSPRGFESNDIGGLVQERRNSSALAMELCLSCSNPSISGMSQCYTMAFQVLSKDLVFALNVWHDRTRPTVSECIADMWWPAHHNAGFLLSKSSGQERINTWSIPVFTTEHVILGNQA